MHGFRAACIDIPVITIEEDSCKLLKNNDRTQQTFQGKRRKSDNKKPPNNLGSEVTQIHCDDENTECRMIISNEKERPLNYCKNQTTLTNARKKFLKDKVSNAIASFKAKKLTSTLQDWEESGIREFNCKDSNLKNQFEMYKDVGLNIMNIEEEDDFTIAPAQNKKASSETNATKKLRKRLTRLKKKINKMDNKAVDIIIIEEDHGYVQLNCHIPMNEQTKAMIRTNETVCAPQTSRNAKAVQSSLTAPLESTSSLSSTSTDDQDVIILDDGDVQAVCDIPLVNVEENVNLIESLVTDCLPRVCAQNVMKSNATLSKRTDVSLTNGTCIDVLGNHKRKRHEIESSGDLIDNTKHPSALNSSRLLGSTENTIIVLDNASGGCASEPSTKKLANCNDSFPGTDIPSLNLLSDVVKSDSHCNPFHSFVESRIASGLRPIAIDGSNIAYSHGKSTVFSSRGIKLCIDYFARRGHTTIKAFVPHFRLQSGYGTIDMQILHDLEKQQIVVLTPSRMVDGKLIVSYDDRFILDYASQTGAIVVSNDNYRDLLHEPQFTDVIKYRLLMFSFADDVFMVPNDPFGRHGPKLDNYLMF